MIERIDGWGIVLAGHWNQMILTPPWVKENVFHGEESEVLITIPPAFAMTFRHEEASMEIAPNRLTFRPRGVADRFMARAERMASDVLSVLVHTPMIGVGINFTFAEREPSDTLLSLFNSPDGMAYAREGWDSGERQLLRNLTRNDQILNVSLRFSSGEVNIDFNFHANVTTTDQARTALTGRFISLRESALAILRDVYNLELHGTHSDE